MNRRITLLATVLTALGVQAYAQTPTAPAMPGVDQRQEQQARRIDQGRQSGALTGREADRLETLERMLATDEKIPLAATRGSH